MNDDELRAQAQAVANERDWYEPGAHIDTTNADDVALIAAAYPETVLTLLGRAQAAEADAADLTALLAASEATKGRQPIPRPTTLPTSTAPPNVTQGAADDLADALAGHKWEGGYYCKCGHEMNSPTTYVRHVNDIALSWFRDTLGSDDMRETVARTLAEMTDEETWASNEALGGNLTGTRDDEYRDAMHDQAREALTAIVERVGGNR